MPTADDVFLLEVPRSGQVFGPDGRSDCCSANVLFTNGFQAACVEREQSFRIRVGGRSFQKIKQPLHLPPLFSANPIYLCDAQNS